MPYLPDLLNEVEAIAAEVFGEHTDDEEDNVLGGYPAPLRELIRESRRLSALLEVTLTAEQADMLAEVEAINLRTLSMFGYWGVGVGAAVTSGLYERETLTDLDAWELLRAPRERIDQRHAPAAD